MEIVRVNNNNIHLLRVFITNMGLASATFRYFNSRPVSVIQNHLVTLLIIDNNQPIAYGHLDVENDLVWLGICVLPGFHDNGFGKIMMEELIDAAIKLKLSRINLRVDSDNKNAIVLYEKFNFKQQKSYGETFEYRLAVNK